MRIHKKIAKILRSVYKKNYMSSSLNQDRLDASFVTQNVGEYVSRGPQLVQTRYESK